MGQNTLLDACIDWYEDHLYAVDSPRREDVIPYLISRLGTPYKVAQELNKGSKVVKVYPASVRWWLIQAGWVSDGRGNWKKEADRQKKRRTRHAN